MVLPYASRRFSGVTVYGAIGTGLQSPCFYISGSTNQTDFAAFIDEIVPQIVPGDVKPVLVIDGHRAHLTVINRELMERHFTVMQMTPSSCEFNSIEWLWSLIKRKFRSKMARLVGTIHSQEDLEHAVEDTLHEIEDSTIQSFATANREFLLKYLDRAINSFH